MKRRPIGRLRTTFVIFLIVVHLIGCKAAAKEGPWEHIPDVHLMNPPSCGKAPPPITAENANRLLASSCKALESPALRKKLAKKGKTKEELVEGIWRMYYKNMLRVATCIQVVDEEMRNSVRLPGCRELRRENRKKMRRAPYRCLLEGREGARLHRGPHPLRNSRHEMILTRMERR